LVVEVGDYPAMLESGPKTYEGTVTFLQPTKEPRWLQLPVVEWTTDCSTGDGAYYFVVPRSYSGYLADVHGTAITAGTTGTMDVQIYNVTKGADMLTTKLTWDSGEAQTHTAATPHQIDPDNRRLDEYDVLRVDIDAVQTTAAKGMILILEIR
jgi:hypothetical protein